MNVRLGVSPIGWSNDDLRDLGADISLQQCLSEAREIGFTGVELGHKFPREPAALKRELEPVGLSLVSGWYGAHLLERSVEDELEALEPHLNLLIAMGCDVLVFAEVTGSVHGMRNVPWNRRPILHPGARQRLYDGLNRVAEHTRARGVRLCYHHHVGTVVETGDEVQDMLTKTDDSVALTMDTGHATFVGASVLDWARSFSARIGHVHLKDIRPGVIEVARLKKSSFLQAVLDGIFTVPGDGMVDTEAVLKALKTMGYRGWLVVEAEQDPAKAPPAEFAQRGYRHVLEAAERVGLQCIRDS